MKAPASRCAIYLRVSTADGRQTTDNQAPPLRRYAEARGWTVEHVYVDEESGRKAAAARKGFDRMMKDAARREFDVVLVWALDRFTREGMRATVDYLRKLDAAGVRFHSYTEELLSTENELVRDVVLAILSSLASVESSKISERTKAGMERATAQGKHVGRPGKQGQVIAHVRRYAGQLGLDGKVITATEIARKIKRSHGLVVSERTVRRCLATIQEEETAAPDLT